MASERQVALTKSQRMPPSPHSSKTAKQGVAPFPQKLYEMVNDPESAELICWSEAGDSFFVFHRERFAHEVLCKWFKHCQFSSFVRQLNMYGFRKILHLQQGVLKSDTDTEFWNFTHESFHRGQRGLLDRIRRKNQPQRGEDGAIDLHDPAGNTEILDGPVHSAGGASENSTQANGTLADGQILDVHTIVGAIEAIQHHQMTIFADLNELKGMSQRLWEDAIAARKRYKEQQDLINKIFKVLAGVFGNHGLTSGGWGLSPASPNPGDREVDGVGENLTMAPNTRPKARLMIEDAKRDGPKNSLVEELTEIPLEDVDEYNFGHSIIEMPIMDGFPVSSAATSDRIAVTETASFTNSGSLNHDPASSSSTSSATESQLPSQHPDRGKQISCFVPPARYSPTSFEFDSGLHGILNQLTQEQIRQLLASLATQSSLSDVSLPSTSNSSSLESNLDDAIDGNNQLVPYTQPSLVDSINTSSSSNSQLMFSNIFQSLGSTDDLIPFNAYGHGPSTTSYNMDINGANSHQTLEDRMERQWHATENIDRDVNALNSSINSLIQTFGLDPSLPALNNPALTNNTQDMDAGMQGGNRDGAAEASDFDFDSFFNHLSTGSGINDMEMDIIDPEVDHNNLVSPAFLNEVQTLSSETTASPLELLSSGLHATTEQINPDVNLHTAAAAGKKRKLEIGFEALTDATDTQSVAIPIATTETPASKRRKDR